MPGDKELQHSSFDSLSQSSTETSDTSQSPPTGNRTYSTLETNLAEQLLALKDGLKDDQTDSTTATGENQRKRRKFVAEELKDTNYWERRKKNNEAAKKSREKRRLNDVIMENKIDQVNRENANLRAELNELKTKLSNPTSRDPYRQNMSETAGYPVPGTSASVKRPTDIVYGQIPHNNSLTPPVTRETIGLTPPHVAPSIVLPISSSAHLPFAVASGYVTVPHQIPHMSVLVPGAPNGMPHLDVLLKKECEDPSDAVNSPPLPRYIDDGRFENADSEYGQSDISDVSDLSSDSPRKSDLMINVSYTERPRGRKRSANPEAMNPKYADPKYADRRRKNNAAARKCRETRKEITRLRAIRSNMLEAENNKLRQEIHSLSTEIRYLKELLDKKATKERETVN
ncbi:uncharacterized protein LOC141900309 [Tubulanus polymorphus]|uniref:uncharacterized protein LOC141900309 n=1 Tax=Tubulanus polymorphus TaxID=672921 RepID=UPI003DA1F91E